MELKKSKFTTHSSLEYFTGLDFQMIDVSQITILTIHTIKVVLVKFLNYLQGNTPLTSKIRNPWGKSVS